MIDDEAWRRGANFDVHFQSLADEPPEDGFRMHFLDVGGGQSVLVESGEETLLYDAGPVNSGGKLLGPKGGEEVICALDHLGIDRLDHVVVSHLDTDHFAQLARGPPDERSRTGVIEHLGPDGVGTLYLPATYKENPRTNELVERLFESVRDADVPTAFVEEGNRLPVSGLDAQVLNPQPDATGGNADMNSAVLHLADRATGRSAVLTGDVHNGGDRSGYVPESHVAEEYAGLLAGVDVFDVPKHGSATPSGDVAEATDDGEGGPEVAVLSFHQHGSHGYPTDSAVDDLNRVGPGRTYGTGVHGCVAVAVGGERIEVYHARGGHVPATANDVGGRTRAEREAGVTPANPEEGEPETEPETAEPETETEPETEPEPETAEPETEPSTAVDAGSEASGADQPLADYEVSVDPEQPVADGAGETDEVDGESDGETADTDGEDAGADDSTGLVDRLRDLLGAGTDADRSTRTEKER